MIIEKLYINSCWIIMMHSSFDIEKDIIYWYEKWQSVDCAEKSARKIQGDMKLLTNWKMIDIIQLYSQIIEL